MRLTLNDTDATRLLKLVEAEEAAYKNWIATAVENGEHDRAKALVTELRELQTLGARIRHTVREG